MSKFTSKNFGIGNAAEGDIFYVDSSKNLVKLAKGTAGQVLTMNTGATAPEWDDVPSSGTSGWGSRVDHDTISANAVITWDNTKDSYDSGGVVVAYSNTGFQVKQAGDYLINLNANSVANEGGYTIVSIRKNGVNTEYATRNYIDNFSGAVGLSYESSAVSAILTLAVDDYIEGYMQESGTGGGLDSNRGTFTINKVG